MSTLTSLEKLLSKRHSCRAFLNTPVARCDIEQIVRVAGLVPSWCNAQPWQIVVTDHEETARFSDALKEHLQSAKPAPDLLFPSGYTGLHKERRRTCGFQLYDAVGIEKGDRAASGTQMMENFNFFGAPHVAIISSSVELGGYGAMDCGGFITAFTLAAQALGIASIPQAAIAPYAPFIRDYFDLAEDRMILCAISFGYADKDHPANAFRTTRAPLGEILDWKEGQ
ncbi:MAG: nitroreductase [Rhodobacteraceae bacterium]|nr:nitroreductase [Paracoccaceae bacterium]